MQVSYHSQDSRHLGRPMEYKVYGHGGRPVVVFPTSNGRFYQYEDSGMIDELRIFIDSGQIQIWTVDKAKLKLSIAVGFDTLYGVSWSPDGKLVAVGCPDNTVRAFEAAIDEIADRLAGKEPAPNRDPAIAKVRRLH